MSNVTREDLLARQDLDPGDPEDRVFVAAAGSPGSETRTTPRTYHDTRDCQNLDGVDESTRAAEQQRWRGPCKVCVLDDVEVADA